MMTAIRWFFEHIREPYDLPTDEQQEIALRQAYLAHELRLVRLAKEHDTRGMP